VSLIHSQQFLYLVSPAYRKTAPHAQHHDKHEKHEEHAPVTMKDDEGKEADVTESMKKAEVCVGLYSSTDANSSHFT